MLPLTRPRGCFAQAGAVAALNNMDETAALVTHYMGNAKMIRETMEGIGFECHGGQVRNPASILKRKSAVNIPHGEFLAQTFLDFEMAET